MNNELLIESANARSAHMGRIDVLERVGTLALLPDGATATQQQVADYFSVPLDTLRSLVEDHRAELEGNGAFIPAGPEYRLFRSQNSFGRGRPSLCFPKRAILNVGMLLRDSDVAKSVRRYLLDTEAGASDSQRGQALHEQAATAGDQEALANLIADMVADRTREIHAEARADIERAVENRVTAAFSPRMVTATATEQVRGSQPLGDFRTALMVALNLAHQNDAFPHLVGIGAIRREGRKHFAEPGWADILEDTVANIGGKDYPTGTVRVRAGKQQEFMNRVRSS